MEPNTSEFVGTTAGGINVAGSIGGTDLNALIQQFMAKLPPEKQSGPNIKLMFTSWLKKLGLMYGQKLKRLVDLINY